MIIFIIIIQFSINYYQKQNKKIPLILFILVNIDFDFFLRQKFFI
jgi:hypothetical protein